MSTLCLTVPGSSRYVFHYHFCPLQKFSQILYGTSALLGDGQWRGAFFCAARPRLAQRMVLKLTNPETKPRRRARRAPDGFHTVTALAASGEPARSSLYRYIKTGLLPAHRWRGRLVIADADFEKLNAVTPLAVLADAKVHHD